MSRESSHGQQITQRAQWAAMAMLVAAMGLAGSSVVVGKLLVTTLPVFVSTFLSLAVAFFCLLPLMAGRFSELRGLSRREIAYLVLQALCGIVLFRVFTLYGLQRTGALQAGLITGATPLVLALFSRAFLGEVMPRGTAVAVLLAVVGCMAVSFDSGGGGGQGSLSGSLLVGAAVVCEALFTIFRKRISASVTATTNTFVLVLCSLVLLAPAALVELAGLPAPPGGGAIVALLYYGAFATVLAYLLWTSAVGRVSGALAGVATAAMPASSMLLAVVVLGERLLPQHLCGAAFIVVAVILAALSSSPRPALIRGGGRNRR